MNASIYRVPYIHEPVPALVDGSRNHRVGVYGVCMARVNVSIPDDVIERAREAGLNVSRLATSALEEALERQLKVAMLDDYLAVLDDELGPIPPEELAAAAALLDSAR
jgi:post-segregation antitoxin (ccd killing protein)